MVCTAGIREDGSWIRLYPVPFSYLRNDGFPKYAWISLGAKRQTSDPRVESYVPADGRMRDVELIRTIDTSRKWAERRKLVLGHVYDSMERLISDAKDPKKTTSLAVYRPQSVLRPIVEGTTSDWDPKWIARANELDLFYDPETDRAAPAVKKVPLRFYYEFTDEKGKKRKLRIIDWEIGALYWKCLAGAEGDHAVATDLVQQKLQALMSTDLHFFLGTTKANHFRAPNPFIIIGLFYPPMPSPAPLFD